MIQVTNSVMKCTAQQAKRRNNKGLEQPYGIKELVSKGRYTCRKQGYFSRRDISHEAKKPFAFKSICARSF